MGSLRLAALLLLLLSSLLAVPADADVDAVTRATTWNTFRGDLASLRDGRVPPQDPDARPFLWEGGGILVLEWQPPLVLDSLRCYIGDVGNNYLVRTYLGGRLDELGVLREPPGVLTAEVADDARRVDRWTAVRFPEGTRADNLEIVALGTIVLYEIELFARPPAATAVGAGGWARLKIRPRSRTPSAPPFPAR